MKMSMKLMLNDIETNKIDDTRSGPPPSSAAAAWRASARLDLARGQFDGARPAANGIPASAAAASAERNGVIRTPEAQAGHLDSACAAPGAFDRMFPYRPWTGGSPLAPLRSFLRARDRMGPMLLTGMFSSVLISS